ncbi:hypothetical protein HPB52_018112 [Rhipicephalus sanguineus]|uniref:Uncharacterized protein n=1 Tax=Rhipicephalus sanguineus TaxID=34632 RepID=A0A9D4Q2J3_RHISA|nr:hypothetical protein HPB52_018112 [Rhipicephalus sanguineus]
MSSEHGEQLAATRQANRAGSVHAGSPKRMPLCHQSPPNRRARATTTSDAAEHDNGIMSATTSSAPGRYGDSI